MADRDSCLGYMRQMQAYTLREHTARKQTPRTVAYASVRGASKIVIASEFVKNKKAAATTDHSPRDSREQ